MMWGLLLGLCIVTTAIAEDEDNRKFFSPTFVRKPKNSNLLVPSSAANNLPVETESQNTNSPPSSRFTNLPDYNKQQPVGSIASTSNSLPWNFAANNVPRNSLVSTVPQYPSNCQNPEVLVKVWRILSNLLDSDGKSVKAPERGHIEYGLILIKKFIEELISEVQNTHLMTKLFQLEGELAREKGTILNDARSLRALLDLYPDNNSLYNDVPSKPSFKYESSYSKQSCGEAFMKLIQMAQGAYMDLLKNPVYNIGNAGSLLANGNSNHINPSGSSDDPSSRPLNKYKDNFQLQSPNMNNVDTSNNMLPSKSQGNYNYNNPMSLLPNYNFLDQLNHNPSNKASVPSIGLTSNGQTQDNTNLPKEYPTQTAESTNNFKNVRYPNLPLQSDYGVNLKNPETVADKVTEQNNPYAKYITNVRPDSSYTSTAEISHNNLLMASNGGVKYSHTGNSPNTPSDQYLDVSALQKLMQSVRVGNDNYENLQKYLNSRSVPFEPLQHGENNFQHNQDYANNNNYNPTLIDLQFKNPGNLINNKLDSERANNILSLNHNSYPNTMDYLVIPNRNTYVANSHNNQLVPDNTLAADNWSGITNFAKSNSNNTPMGEIELTYALKQPNPLLYEPYYLVKYRVPYDTFVQNLRQLLARKMYARTDTIQFYKDLVPKTNVTEISPDLLQYPKEELRNLIQTTGSLIDAKYIDTNAIDDDATKVPDRMVLNTSDALNVGYNLENHLLALSGAIPKQNELNAYNNYKPGQASPLEALSVGAPGTQGALVERSYINPSYGVYTNQYELFKRPEIPQTEVQGPFVNSRVPVNPVLLTQSNSLVGDSLNAGLVNSAALTPTNTLPGDAASTLEQKPYLIHQPPRIYKVQ